MRTGGAAALARAPYRGHGSIDEAYVLGARSGERLSLVDAAGARLTPAGQAFVLFRHHHGNRAVETVPPPLN